MTAPIRSATDFLNLFVVRSDDTAAKKRIARALLLAFPDPAQEHELTHVRAVLTPIHNELAALSQSIQGDLATEGRKQEESFLTVAILVCRTEFLQGIQGYAGRRQCFRALVELICADLREARGHSARLLGAAVRDDLEVRSEPGKATSIAPLPDFSSVLELVRWFDNGENLKHPFATPFRREWDSRHGSLERRVLLVQNGHSSPAAHAPGWGHSLGLTAVPKIWLAADSPVASSMRVSTSMGQMPNSG
jgi:hypothetical protein